NLRFEVVGKQLKLFVNNVPTALAYDASITAAGMGGMRGALNATLDDFSAATVSLQNTTAPFTDTFTKPNNAALDRVWTERQGAYVFQNTRAADAANLAAVSLATLNTAALANV